MRRRTLLLGGIAGGALAATRALAQQARQFRVGVLSPLSGLAGGPYLAALREQLGKHGFVAGRNLAIDLRYPEFNPQSAMETAKELAALKPDAIFAFSTAMASGALAATRSVPIVFAWVSDPVRSGLVKDLARPGGNVTGVTNRAPEMATKRVELLREALPRAKRIAAVAGYFDAVLEVAMQSVQQAAGRSGFELVRISTGTDWSRAVDVSLAARAEALLIMTPFAFFGMLGTAAQVVRSATERRVPAIFWDSETVELGGLMSYSTNLADDARRGADLVARVLKGEKPGSLAVDQAARFELVVNLKTARAIGLALPRSILVRADRVIE